MSPAFIDRILSKTTSVAVYGTRRAFLTLFGGLTWTLATGSASRGAELSDLEPTLAAFADVLLPPGDGAPAASELGLAQELLRRASADASIRSMVVAGCTWLNTRARSLANADFGADAASGHRLAIVEELAGEPAGEAGHSFFQWCRHDLITRYYADRRTWLAIGYYGPPQPAGFPDYARAPEI